MYSFFYGFLSKNVKIQDTKPSCALQQALRLVTQPPTQALLRLDCSTQQLSESEQISVSCTSNRDIATLLFVCVTFTEGCELLFFNPKLSSRLFFTRWRISSVGVLLWTEWITGNYSLSHWQ